MVNRWSTKRRFDRIPLALSRGLQRVAGWCSTGGYGEGVPGVVPTQCPRGIARAQPMHILRSIWSSEGQYGHLRSIWSSEGQYGSWDGVHTGSKNGSKNGSTATRTLGRKCQTVPNSAKQCQTVSEQCQISHISCKTVIFHVKQSYFMRFLRYT